MALQTVADRFDLDVAHVSRSLAYYYKHPEEMDEPRIVTDPDEIDYIVMELRFLQDEGTERDLATKLRAAGHDVARIVAVEPAR